MLPDVQKIENTSCFSKCTARLSKHSMVLQKLKTYFLKDFTLPIFRKKVNFPNTATFWIFKCSV